MHVSREELEFHLLSFLARGEGYGYEMMKNLSAKGIDIDIPYTYRVLKSLTQRRFLNSDAREMPKTDAAARSQYRRRTYFRMTELGMNEFNRLRKKTTAMVERLQASLKETPAAGKVAGME